MKYLNIEQAYFKERPNRFIAYVETKEGREICHVKNTGRCRELLVPDAKVYVQRNDNPSRKTKLDLIGVRKGDYLINMDSQAPNAAVRDSCFQSKQRFFLKRLMVNHDLIFTLRMEKEKLLWKSRE